MRASPGTLHVDVHSPGPARLGAFAIVTAYNPASAATRTHANRAALRGLRAALDREGLHWLAARAHGGARWSEPGFALTGPDAHPRALALGERLGQNAILLGRAGALPRLAVTRAGFCGRRVGDLL